MVETFPLYAGSGRFELRRRLGQGGMGIVYEAFDRDRNARVALKTIHTRDAASLLRFKNEFRGLADITHPHLVALHELFAGDDGWYFTMELLDGVALDAYATDETRLRTALAQLAQGVHALHLAGRLHCDLKPSNMLVTGEPRAVLVDFGVIAEIGKAGTRSIDGDAFVVGTPAYMAPEQARGEITPASDWYAFGSVLFQLLTGSLPFTGTSREILVEKNRQDAPPVASLTLDAPTDLARLADALLAREPSSRPGAADVLRALDVATPSRVRARASSPAELVGRDAELAVLRAAYDDTQRGNGRLVLIRGLSGMGKSSLCGAFLDEVRRDRDAVVLSGRCYPQESVPYEALDDLVDALAVFLTSLPRADADALVPRDVLLLPRIFPVLGGVPAIAGAERRPMPELDPRELRRRAFAALRELLTRLASARPLVLFVDDLQWGDLDSAAALDGLLRPPDPPPFLLVLAYRAEDSSRSAFLQTIEARRDRLGSRAATVAIELGALGRKEARALAADVLGAPADKELVTAIADEAAGAPFFVRELAEAARTTQGTWPSLEQLIGERVDRLDRGERLLLELVALSARPVAAGVAASASRMASADLERAIRRLVEERLARRAHDRQGVVIECYHDRIREHVIVSLADARRHDLHERLARAIAAGAAPDVEALAIHSEGAGDLDAAAAYALRAAEQAVASLAFDRAAGWYAHALERGRHDVATRRALRARRGEALAAAGRGAEAAVEFAAAAEGANVADQLELRRRAASQYLRSGHVEAGLSTLRDVLAEVGERLPTSPLRAVLSLVAARVQLRLRGVSFQRRDPSQIAAAELVHVDVLRSAATDLGMVDTITGAAFGTRQLLLALRLGEPLLVARALVVEATFLAALGRPTAKRAAMVLETATQLVGTLDDRELPAWISAARGLTAYMEGRFRVAAEHADDAIEQLRSCIGVTWETGGVEVQALWSRFYLGDLRMLMARSEAVVEQARSHGNRFDEANVCTGLPALVWAVADRTAEGRAEVAHVMSAWSTRGFHLQHYYELLALVSFDLFDGRIDDAVARLAARWRDLLKSRLFVCPSVEIEAQHLRARVAIAADQPAELRAAIKRLAAHGDHLWAHAFAQLARAGRETEPAAIDAALALAIEACTAAEMKIFVLAARRRRAELAGGAAACAEADQALRAEAVKHPERFSRMLVPLGGPLR
ncbi:MAG TPA: AAA family ATPase [Kofleriaceae bacterium]|nr:AAA family ATPase [Kofleriaceae bacterium]